MQLIFVSYSHDFTLRKTGGFLNTPTPGGVPVRNTSPGVNVTNLTGGKAHSGGPESVAGRSMCFTVASNVTGIAIDYRK